MRQLLSLQESRLDLGGFRGPGLFDGETQDICIFPTLVFFRVADLRQCNRQRFAADCACARISLAADPGGPRMIVENSLHRRLALST